MEAGERPYHNYIKAEDLIKFEVIEKETDLLIQAKSNLYDKAFAGVLKYRGDLEKYIASDPKFRKAFAPYRVQLGAPPIVKQMAAAARKAGVGPMAAVAGAIAEFVGRDLLPFSDELIIENGSDIFLKTSRPRQINISEKISLEIDPRLQPFSVCISSGTAGSSFSFGKADAVVIIADSALLADAAATAIGNIIKEPADIEKGLKMARKIKNLYGALIIKDDQLGVLGKIKIVPA